jgi:hypothetical protein
MPYTYLPGAKLHELTEIIGDPELNILYQEARKVSPRHYVLRRDIYEKPHWLSKTKAVENYEVLCLTKRNTHTSVENSGMIYEVGLVQFGRKDLIFGFSRQALVGFLLGLIEPSQS